MQYKDKADQPALVADHTPASAAMTPREKQTISKPCRPRLPQRFRAFHCRISFGWVPFFHLIEQIVLWPLPVQIDVQIPGDSRAYRMGHMEAITQGLLFDGAGLWRAIYVAEHKSRSACRCGWR